MIRIMSMLTMLHRTAALFAATSLLFGADANPKRITARQVIERIQAQVGVPWQTQTVDTFKAGSPDTPVTGIATTFAATMDVLQRAAASGKNLIIAHEPTFYNHLDRTSEMEGDAVLAAKQRFIKDHNLVVFRFHDHWHARHPDGVLRGMTEALGWNSYQHADNPSLYTVPATTLAAFASQINSKLKIRTMRVIGDPAMKLSKVAMIPGAAPSTLQMKALENDDVEALVIGESREWETVEYTRDAVAQGRHKALLVLGHVPSEEAGMIECAKWLKTFVTEVPVEFVPAGEVFWAPR
jgi:putative NIF3 family GTP cyclohydrolase 1 type 2